MIELREWQQKAMDKIKSTLTGSIVECSTGAGKTPLALKMVEDRPTDKVLIVVPTIVLQDQWKDEIINFKIATDSEITLIGGGNKPSPGKRITVAVVNSLRNVNWNHPMAKYDLLILDEIHRYASEENVQFLRKGTFGYKLGMTATLRRSDGMEKLLEQLVGPVVYRIGNQEAIDEGYIADYEVFLKPVSMNETETNKYNDVDTIVKENLKIFNNNFNEAQKVLKSGPRNRMFPYAVKVMKGIQARKSAIVGTVSKIAEAISICDSHRENRIIIFDELQSSANELHKQLNALGMPAVIYHSGLKNKKDKKAAIQKYVDGEVDIIVSVKALDEGLNVKDCDIGIVVNGNSQQRQILQRLGRVLRKKEGKKAELYMLYVPGTIDEKYVKKRLTYLKPVSWEDESMCGGE